MTLVIDHEIAKQINLEDVIKKRLKLKGRKEVSCDFRVIDVTFVSLCNNTFHFNSIKNSCG